MPGVDASAVAYPLPFSGGGLTSGFRIKGRDHKPGEPEWHGEAYFVSPGYFETLRIGLLRGRMFSDADNRTAPVVCMVDAKLADRYFPGQDPIGQEIAMYRGWARIVGVVRTIRSTTIEEEARPVVYYPLVQVPFFPQAGVLVRSRTAAFSTIREAVRRTNGSVALFDTRSLESRMAESLGVRRVVAVLVAVFAVICLLLATIGVHGVVAQTVGERKPEIGVRMALGARPAQILFQFLRYGLTWGLIGLVTGLAASTIVQTWMTGLLFGVKPLDPATFTVAALGVLTAILLSVWWPAWRASRVNPQTVLRYE